MNEYWMGVFEMGQMDSLHEIESRFWRSGISTRVVISDARKLVLFATMQDAHTQWAKDVVDSYLYSE